MTIAQRVNGKLIIYSDGVFASLFYRFYLIATDLPGNVYRYTRVLSLTFWILCFMGFINHWYSKTNKENLLEVSTVIYRTVPLVNF